MKQYLRGITKLLLVAPLMLWYVNGLAQHTVTGTVTDSNDEILPGVNVVVKGTVTGTSTGADGTYELSVPSSADTLIFSFIGFQTQEIPINGRSVIDVQLVSEIIAGEELVVVGYGEQTKESIVGAISTVSGGELVKAQSSGNFLSALQGSVPGLTVVMQDAAPGETDVEIQIRAGATMGNASPLLIVDGVEQPLSYISDISPSVVANVSILKGASATAVYGVKAANGVMIIQTKRGREGIMNFTFSSETTLKQPSRLPEFLNAYETLKLRNVAFKNDGRWEDIISDEVLEHYRLQDSPYLYPDFDWNEYLWGPAVDHRYDLSASGGNETVRFFTSLGYLRENDILNSGQQNVFQYERDPSYKSDRFNFRNNLDFYLTDNTRFSVQMSGTMKDVHQPIDYYTQELMFTPVTSRPFYPAEALEQFPDPRIPYNQTGVRPWINPDQGVARLLWTGGMGVEERKSNDFNASLVLNQELDFLIQGLEVEGRYAYQSDQIYRAEFNNDPFYAYYLNPADTTWTRYDHNGGIDLNSPQEQLDVDPTKGLDDAGRSHYYRLQLDYDQNFGGSHNVAATGVFSRRKARNDDSFPSFEEAWAGRATYNYQNRYFVESAVSYTGSEKFAPGLRFGFFPSFGAGWMVSNEEFFSETLPWFNHLKVKYSWGKIGSDSGIGRWLYRTSYDTGGGVTFGYPRQGYGGISEGDVPVTNATWETSVKQNLGIEVGLLQNLFTLNVDVYKELRSDILLTRNMVPSWFGTDAPSANLGEIKAHGIEVEFDINKTFDNGLNLFLNTTLSSYETRIVEWDESEFVPFYMRLEGKPVAILQSNPMEYQVLGYYQTFDELFIQPVGGGTSTPIVGDQKFLDFNGSGEIGDLDRIVSEHPYRPKYDWNATLGLNYKRWSARLQFYGVSDVNIAVRGGGEFYLYPFTQNKDEAMTIHADYWRPDNRDAAFPAVHAHAQEHYNYRASTFSGLNGKYVRLKRASIGYSLQSDALANMGVDQIQLSLTGVNLWLWTKLPFGGDPEGGNYGGAGFGSYPIQRRFSFRAEVTF